MPSHQAGDLAVAFAFRDGSTTPPAAPAGWVSLTGGGGNSCAARLMYRHCQSDSEGPVVVNDATSVVVQVYRGITGIGAVHSPGGNSATINYTNLGLQNTSGTSWVVRFAGHRTASDLLSATPAGHVARAGTPRVRGIDTGAAVASAPLTSQTVDTADGWRSASLELRGDVAPPMHTLTDDFSSTLDTGTWPLGSGATTSGGQLTIVPYGSAISDLHDMTDSHFGARFVSGTGWLGVASGIAANLTPPTQGAATHALQWAISGGLATPQYRANGAVEAVGDTLNTAFSPWLAIQVLDGTAYFLSSQDGNSWSTNFITEVAIPTGLLRAFFNAGGSSAVFDDANMLATLPNARPRKAHRLSDDFDSKDTYRWRWFGDADVLDGQLVLPTPDSTIVSSIGYDFTDSSVAVELVEVPAATDAATSFGPGTATLTVWEGDLRSASGAVVAAYDPEAHRWLRVRESGGTTYQDVSPDGSNWTTVSSFPTPWNFTNTAIILTSSGSGDSGPAVFDNLNITPPPSGQSSGTLGWVGAPVGHRDPLSESAGTHSWAGTAVGAIPTPRGKASGTLSWTADPVGYRVPKATASGTYTLVDTANAVYVPVAQAAGQLSLASTAVATYSPNQPPGVIGWWPEVDGKP